MTLFIANFRRRHMKGVERFTIHDFRRTLATGVAAIVKDRFKVKLILNHVVSSDVTGVYDLYSYNDVKLDALTRWEEHVRSLLPQSVIDLSLTDKIAKLTAS
jgi:integrase